MTASLRAMSASQNGPICRVIVFRNTEQCHKTKQQSHTHHGLDQHDQCIAVQKQEARRPEITVARDASVQPKNKKATRVIRKRPFNLEAAGLHVCRYVHFRNAILSNGLR